MGDLKEQILLTGFLVGKLAIFSVKVFRSAKTFTAGISNLMCHSAHDIA